METNEVGWLREKLSAARHNHLLMMALCCIVPVGVILFLIGIGYGGSGWIYLMIVICPAMHYFMMKDMHTDCEEKKTEVELNALENGTRKI